MDIFFLTILYQLLVGVECAMHDEKNITGTLEAVRPFNRQTEGPHVNYTRLLLNVECDIHEHVVWSGLPEDDFPYYVKIYRCEGATMGASGTSRRECVPTSVESVKFSRYRDNKEFYLKNHTHCQYKCKNDNSLCSRYQKWSDEECRCLCTREHVECGRHAEWDKLECKCRCLIHIKEDCMNQQDGLFNDTDCTCRRAPIMVTGTGYGYSFKGFSGNFSKSANRLGITTPNDEWVTFCETLYDTFVNGNSDGDAMNLLFDKANKITICKYMMVDKEQKWRQKEEEELEEEGFFGRMVDIKVVFIVAFVEPIVILIAGLVCYFFHTNMYGGRKKNGEPLLKNGEVMV